MWFIVLYVAPASLKAPGHASKRWEWCKGLMHVLCIAAIPCEADICSARVALLGPTAAIDRWVWLYASL